MSRRILFSLVVWTLLAVLLVAACAAPPPTCPPLKPGEVELEFETIDQSIHSQAVNKGVFLITGLQDVHKLEGFLHKDARELLANVDYGRFFAVAVFQGNQKSGGYKVTIERLSVKEHELRICAIFLEPGPHQPVTTLETSPYHIVKFATTDLPDINSVVLQSLTTTP
ncbi:MAG: protease complex subunit PrcB family protein [Chloroflexi bacterium]|nr:protease complex subunit PrcB family protein [Chloroflexota bacterium]